MRVIFVKINLSQNQMGNELYKRGILQFLKFTVFASPISSSLPKGKYDQTKLARVFVFCRITFILKSYLVSDICISHNCIGSPYSLDDGLVTEVRLNSHIVFESWVNIISQPHLQLTYPDSFTTLLCLKMI